MSDIISNVIFTASKRSLGHGYTFSSVCQGLCPQGRCLVPGGESGPGGWLPGPRGVSGPGGVPGPGGLVPVGVWRPPEMATAAGGTHPTEMHSC